MTDLSLLILEFLKTGSKTSLEICSHFNLPVIEVTKIMKGLKHDGCVWQCKQRTLGNRSVSRWGIKGSE